MGKDEEIRKLMQMQRRVMEIELAIGRCNWFLHFSGSWEKLTRERCSESNVLLGRRVLLPELSSPRRSKLDRYLRTSGRV